MASTIRCRMQSNVSVVETFDGFVSPADDTATFNQLSEDEALTAATSVPVTKHSEFEQAMSAGAATINLAALPGRTVDETIVGTGLKVQVAKFRNKSTNANAITISEGASNGYALLGASFSFILLPGQSVLLSLDEAAPDIASGDRTIDIAGTGSQVLECQFVLG